MKLINKIKLIVLFAVMLVASLCIAACSGNDNDSVKIPDYPSKIEGQHNTYTDLQDGTVVTIDGTITEAEWEKQNKWEETINISGYDHHIEIWSRFAEEGVVMAYRVTGAPAYYNAGRGNYANSGIEIYIANGKATTAAGNQWEMEFFANGAYHTSKYIKFNGHDGYASSNSYVDVAGRWLDKNGNTTYVNDPENNGYEDEVMIPWYSLGGKCDSIVFNAAIQYMASETATSRSGYVNMLGKIEGDYYWTSCQSWRRFDKDGYYDKSKGEFAMTPYDVGTKAYNDGYAFTEHGWNNGSSQLYYNTPVAAGEDYILTAKLYAPHLAHEEGSEGWNKNYANETNYLPQGQGGTETAYNGLSATRNGYKIELAFQKGWGSDGVFFRWNGGDWGWTNVKLSSAQLEKYMTEGLNVGMYVKGNVVTPLLENDAGELVMLDGGMVKTIDKWATAGETKLAVYYQCDTRFDQWKVYAGEAINGSLTVIDETAADAHGSVTAVGKMYDTVTINVTPEEGYELASLLVNGVEYAARVENNVVTAKVTGTKATVKATFRQTINQAITLNVTRKFAYEAKAYSADGAEIILTDAEGNAYTGLVANGQVTVKIVDGTYTLTAKGYANATPVTVENGQASLTDVVLLRKLFNDVDETVTAKLTAETATAGATLQTTVQKDKNDAPLDNKQWKIENFDSTGKVVFFYTLAMDNIGPSYATIETSRSSWTINQGDWTFNDGGYYDAPNNKWELGGHILHKGSASFMVIFEGVNIGLYYKSGNEWKLISNFQDSEGKLTFINFNHGEHASIITWSDIKLYDGARAEEILKNTATLEYDQTVAEATISKTTGIEKGEEVTVTAAVKDSATHQIASVTVNGTVLTAGEDGTYKFTANSYMGTYKVVVTAETLATELTFTTTHKFAYEKAYYNLPDGTVLNFVNGDIVKPATVNNGKVTISLSNGTYTVNGVAVTVANGNVESTDLQFTRTLFSAVDETVTAKFTAETATAGATLQTTVKENKNVALDDKQWKIENFDNTGKVVLLYTLAMGSERQCYATIGTNRHLYAINQGHWDDTTGYYDAPNNKWTVGVKHSEPTTFMAIFEGRAIQLYYKVNGVWKLLADYEDQGEGELKSLTFTHGEHSAIITWSDIKLYDGARVDALLLNTASVAADSSEQADVVLSKTTAIAKGEEVTATVTLKDSENYHIVSVSVNGTVLTGEAGVYKFTADSYASEYAVKVVTEATAHEVAATAQYKYAYENDLYNMPDGTELTFTSGSIKKTATVKDGKLTIALSNGEYTVSGDRIQSFALVVTDEITTAKFEAKRLTLVATDESKMTITEDENGAAVTFNGKTFNSAYALLPTISGKTVIKGTYVGAGSWDDSLDFLNADKTQNDYLLNIGSWGEEGNYTVDLKWLNASDTMTGNANKDSGVFQVKFAIVIDGNSITGYSSVLKADGTWEEYKTKTGLTAKTLLFGFASGGTGACSFKNVTIAALTGDYNPNN